MNATPTYHHPMNLVIVFVNMSPYSDPTRAATIGRFFDKSNERNLVADYNFEHFSHFSGKKCQTFIKCKKYFVLFGLSVGTKEAI